MSDALFYAGAALVWGPILLYRFLSLEQFAPPSILGWAVWLASGIVGRNWVGVALSAAGLLFWLRWWWRRRRRDRAKGALGAKSKALRDALVRRMRELRPRPLLRPVPNV